MQHFAAVARLVVLLQFLSFDILVVEIKYTLFCTVTMNKQCEHTNACNTIYLCRNECIFLLRWNL